MQEHKLEAWKHSHSFGQDQKQQGEARTLIVIAITSSMMVVEIAAGLAFGSMALLADGLHMGSHAAALGINAFAYVYARKHAQNEKYSFGTGKVNTLGGYTGAVLLAVFAALMAWESIVRLFNPVSIAFNQAIFVFILGVQHDHSHDHGHEHHHDHHHHHDHNLMSAYLHVLADALTSLLAIIALLIGKYYGAIWMDPLMGIVGAILVARWSIGLLKSTSSVLLDEQGPQETRDKIRQSIEEEGIVQVVDLHVWSVGPGIHSAMISVVAMDPMPPSHYKEKLQQSIRLDHLTVEVHPYPSDD
jgi:cation diffusion facilitator family transporter